MSSRRHGGCRTGLWTTSSRTQVVSGRRSRRCLVATQLSQNTSAWTLRLREESHERGAVLQAAREMAARWVQCHTLHNTLRNSYSDWWWRVESTHSWCAERDLKPLECKAIIVPHRIIPSWYTGRWWVGCYIWYSEEGTGRVPSPPRPLLAVPNVTAHPSTTSVPITVLRYIDPLLCGFNVPVKGLIYSKRCKCVAYVSLKSDNEVVNCPFFYNAVSVCKFR